MYGIWRIIHGLCYPSVGIFPGDPCSGPCTKRAKMPFQPSRPLCCFAPGWVRGVATVTGVRWRFLARRLRRCRPRRGSRQSHRTSTARLRNPTNFRHPLARRSRPPAKLRPDKARQTAASCAATGTGVAICSQAPTQFQPSSSVTEGFLVFRKYW